MTGAPGTPGRAQVRGQPGPRRRDGGQTPAASGAPAWSWARSTPSQKPGKTPGAGEPQPEAGRSAGGRPGPRSAGSEISRVR
eukprot:2970018-Pyramimonas_sp.AAC.1